MCVFVCVGLRVYVCMCVCVVIESGLVCICVCVCVWVCVGSQLWVSVSVYFMCTSKWTLLVAYEFFTSYWQL